MPMTTLLGNRVVDDPTAVLLSSGPLGRAGGVIVFGGMPPSPVFEALVQEAYEAYKDSARLLGDQSHTGPARSRMPRRALSSSPGGPVQDTFYADPWLQAFVTGQAGVPVTPSGNRGSYSYYERPGDYLDLHLDVYDCDVTLITVLHDDTDPYDTSGGVAVYRDSVGQPLESIRANPDRGMTVVKPTPGQSLLILGGLVPHRVLPFGTSGCRIVSPLCFQAHLGSSPTSNEAVRQFPQRVQLSRNRIG